MTPLEQYPTPDEVRGALVYWKSTGEDAPLREVLSRYWFSDVDKALTNITKMAEDDLSLDRFVELVPRLLEYTSDSPVPDMTLNNWERFIHATIDAYSLYHQVCENVNVFRFLNRVFSSSYFLSDILVRNPEYYNWLIQANYLSQARKKVDLLQEFSSSIKVFKTPERRHDVLCRLRRREILRIGARDVLELSDVQGITRELSDLAEAVLYIALEESRIALINKYGKPLIVADAGQRDCAFSIIAMGKLGARELNFSSDIDLVFVYEDEGQTTGINADGEKVRSVSNHLFFMHLCRGLLKFLSGYTSEGRLYRSDIRLRPEGETGPLGRSLESYANYFYSQARFWECIAYLKARPVAGSDRLGVAFRRLVEQFIFYPREPETSRAEIFELKQRIDYEIEEQGLMQRDVKRGFGGIREIEFLVSTLQLMYASQYPELNVVGTFDAVRTLHNLGLFEQEEADFILNAYSFLRKVEHRLQILWEAQTHVIPEQPGEIQVLALRMGYKGDNAGKKLLEDYRNICNRIHGMFVDFFHPEKEEMALEMRDLLLLLDPGEEREKAFTVLQRFRFNDPGSVIYFHRLFHGTREMYIPASAKKTFEQLVPSILEMCRGVPYPDTAMRNVTNFVEATKAVGAFFDFAVAQPAVLRALLNLFGTCDSFSRILIAHPEFFEPLMTSLSIGDIDFMLSPDKGFSQFFSTPPKTPEDIMKQLRRFKQFWSVLIAMYDLTFAPSADEVSCALTNLAQLVIGRVYYWVSSNTIGKYGIPRKEGTNDPAGFICLAFGGIGGGEINYFSDLDMVFVMDGEGTTSRKNGINNKLYFTRLAEEYMNEMASLTPDGKFYNIDTRLRPQGSSGELVCTTGRFLNYYKREAQLWELQSFLKARPVMSDEDEEAGDVLVGKVEETIVHRLSEISVDQIREHILDMRHRLEESVAKLPARAAAEFKRGTGGLVDIEFAVQYLQLRHLADHPGIFMPETLDAIHSLKFHSLLSEEHAETLLENYLFLRRLEARLRLIRSKSEDYFPADEERVEALAYAMDIYDNPVQTLQNKFESVIRTNRNIFNNILSSE